MRCRQAAAALEDLLLQAEEHSLAELSRYCAEQVDTLWDEVKRFENPHQYYVDLSLDLWTIKNRLLEEHNVN